MTGRQADTITSCWDYVLTSLAIVRGHLPTLVAETLSRVGYLVVLAIEIRGVLIVWGGTDWTHTRLVDKGVHICGAMRSQSKESFFWFRRCGKYVGGSVCLGEIESRHLRIRSAGMVIGMDANAI